MHSIANNVFQQQVGLVRLSAATQVNYVWDDEKKETLQQWRQYTYDLISLIDKLEENGPEGLDVLQVPKTNINSLIRPSKPKSKEMNVDELQTFLVKRLETNPEYFSVIVNINDVAPVSLYRLEDIKTYLITGYRKLQKQNTGILACYIQFGKWLVAAMDCFRMEKRKITWKQWLEQNIGISDRYARELKEMAELVGKFPKFQKLHIRFTELYKLRNKIKMLLKHQPYANFWAQQ